MSAHSPDCVRGYTDAVCSACQRAAAARILGHSHDADCAGHITDDSCTVCGVWHGDPCATCGGRGYHAAGCAESDEAGR